MKCYVYVVIIIDRTTGRAYATVLHPSLSSSVTCVLWACG